jgi:hypothetical protein
MTWAWASAKAVALGVVVGSFGAGAASAAVISDATGEEFSGSSHLDIRSVEVTNDAGNITFTIGLVGDPVATNWGKYMIGIDSLAGGDTAGNGWGRPISMGSGMDYWVGSWVDSGSGAEVHRFDATQWVRDRASYDAANPLAVPVVTADAVSLTLPLASLGLSDGDTIRFDVYSGGGGGGDSANDAASNPNQSTTGWGGPYDSGDFVSSYTVVVPEPASLGILGLGAAAFLKRRRR